MIPALTPDAPILNSMIQPDCIQLTKRTRSIFVRPDLAEAVIKHYTVQGWTVTQRDTFRCVAPEGAQSDYIVTMEI